MNASFAFNRGGFEIAHKPTIAANNAAFVATSSLVGLTEEGANNCRIFRSTMDACASIVDRHEEGREGDVLRGWDSGSEIRAGHYRAAIRSSTYNQALSRNRLAIG